MSSENLPSPSKSIDWDARLPWTWGLVSLLVCVHLATGVWDWWQGYESLFDALVMDRSTRMRVAVGGQLDLNINQGEVFRLATSTVLHGDLLHLVVNSLAIVGLGRIVEPLFGGYRLFLAFSVGAVFASLMSHFAGVLQSDGASGGAFTLLAVATLIGLRHWRQWEPDSKRLMGPILWAFVGLNLVLSVVLPFVDGLGHGAGFVAGLVIGWWPQGRWKGLEYSVGALWSAAYLAALGFGAYWVLYGWTAVKWSRYWTGS